MPVEPLPKVPKEEEKPSVSTEPVSVPESGPTVPETAPEKQGERIEGKYLEILQKTSPGAPATVVKDDEVKNDAKTIGALTDEETKVKRLLDLAQEKGVAQAVKVAYALKDYYVLDRMHDELADKLYDGLVAKGLITKE